MKTDIFDKEGVLQRMDIVQQLQQQLQGAQEQIKKLSGDLQTRDRESVNLRKRIEVEKFKTELDGVSQKAKAGGTVYEKRLDDSLSTVKQQIKDLVKETSSPPPGRKGAAKKRKKS